MNKKQLPNEFGSSPKELLIQAQEIGLHTPHLYPLPQGERKLDELPPPSMGGGKGEGDSVNLFNSFAIIHKLMFCAKKRTCAILHLSPFISLFLSLLWRAGRG